MTCDLVNFSTNSHKPDVWFLIEFVKCLETITFKIPGAQWMNPTCDFCDTL